MEVIERIPLIRLHFLATLPFADFKTIGLCKSEAKNDDERKQNYNYMLSYCNSLIKGKGEMKRCYAYTDPTPLQVGGRLYSGLSIQGVSSKIRGFLFDGITTDIDMRNAHPVILRYICKQNNFDCPNLDYYINNRDEILARFDETGKTEFLKAVNSDKTNKKMKDKFYKDFDKECKDIQQFITKLEKYKHIVDTVPTNRTYNWVGSAINRILCVYENKILHEVINYVNRYESGIEISALMFDGLMVYGDYYNNHEFLNNLDLFVESKFEGLKMKFACKPHKTGIINMPDNFEIGDKKEIKVIEKSFEKVSEQFELKHCKITNKGIFIKELNNDNIVMSKQHLKTSYEHMVYEKLDKDGNIKHCNFINDWLINNENQRKFEDVDVYPKSDKCPENIFNMWRKFEMELITDYTPNLEALEFIKNHLKVLCDNDEVIYNYFIAWIAQMIQYPEVKSTCPTLISKEGAGKGTLMRLFEKMLGSSKIFETTNPSRDVWGDFNGVMANCFLVNLNELSKKETLESEGKIKGLITEPNLYINNKGVNKFQIKSFHRFMIQTNNEEPITTKKDERRKFIIRCSDKLIGDKEYFNKCYKYLDDVNVIKTCFEYFKSIPNMDKFSDLQLPISEYQHQLQELSVSHIENWIKAYTLENYYEKPKELHGQEQLKLFKDWSCKCGIDYNVNLQAFGVRLSRLNINGILKGKHTNKGETKIFDFTILREYFKLNITEIIEDSDEMEEIEQ